MVYGDHDLSFKRLNSQLCKECEELCSSAPGHRLLEAAEVWQSDDGHSLGVMAATAAHSGRTLRELAGDQPLPSVLVSSTSPLCRAIRSHATIQ